MTLVTQTVVDAEDPAFASPTKFVGSVYDEVEAKALADEHEWTFAQDGDSWRRVVASPVPQRIVETETADLLLRHGTTVVLAGGGGVPVVVGEHGLEGVEAVVDKDLVAALVAEQLGADLLLVLTDVPAVMVDFGTPGQRPLGDVTIDDLEERSFPSGSMGPKVDAVCQFVHATGKPSCDRVPRRRGRSLRRHGRHPGPARLGDLTRSSGLRRRGRRPTRGRGHPRAARSG